LESRIYGDWVLTGPFDVTAQGGHTQFFAALLGFIYSDTFRISGKQATFVHAFLGRCNQLGIKFKRTTAGIKPGDRYPPSRLLRSTASEIARDLKRHWNGEAKKIHGKVNAPTLVAITIRSIDNQDAIETNSFIILNHYVVARTQRERRVDSGR
jgi:hypothetical protein